MDLAAIKLEEIINIAVNSNIPKKKIIEFFKPWWNEAISQKKIKLNQMKKEWKQNRKTESYKAYTNAKNNYFNVIKTAKQSLWNIFLEKA